MSKKRVILSDSSLNRYGYRVLTEGIELEAFKKNPVMLYMHFRDEGSPYFGEQKAIGHWEDIELDGDQLSAVPVFDKADDLSKTIAAKFEAGTFNAASIGILVLETSEDKSVLVTGQTRATVTRCELIEASIVDIPANSNAVRLYDRSSSVQLAAGLVSNVVPEISDKKMNLKATWAALLGFLGIAVDAAESTTLSIENLDKVNAEMARLQSENKTLVDAKKQVDEQLSAVQAEIATLKTTVSSKDAEIATLKTQATEKDGQLSALTQQVNNLKAQPGKTQDLKPGEEPAAQEPETLEQFCKKADANDYVALVARIKSEGL